MKRNIRYAAVICALFVIGGAVAGFNFSGGAPAAALTTTAHAPETKPAQVKEIDGYRAWTKVNPQPVHIAPKLSIACAILTAPPTDDSRNPHTEKLITVYVNEVGRQAMLTELKPKFPVGSVIVKEKLPEQSETDRVSEPELLTVMIKREHGFNPKVGDWEFMATNGAGTKVDARGRLESCQACHVVMKDRDFVSRIYLPEEWRSKLR